MAGTDHGEVLTRFEEIFGSVVEHEVIKLILQSCEWDAATASDTLLGMIDRNNLPSHVLSALTADSIVRSLARREPSSEPSEIQDMAPQVSNRQIQGNLYDSYINQSADNADKPPMSTISDSTSEKSVIVPPSVSAFHACPSTPSHTREGGGDVGSPLSTSTIKSGESVSSSPSFSPLRLSKNVAGDALESNASQWVLAPEFVPNAFNIKSPDVGNLSGVWPQGMSSRLISALPSANAHYPEQGVKGGRLSKKEVIINKILQGTKILILMRGLPGSGKSTQARELKGAKGVVLSTDDFFCNKQGKYIYDASKIGEAHQWNKHRACQRLKQGKSPIIIDNTNLQRWEMMPYVKLALQYGYDVELLDADSPWRLNTKELVRKNSHGVPAKKIEEMKERYEMNIKIEDMVAGLQGCESTSSSPSKKSTSKEREVITIGNDSEGTEVTKLSPLKTPMKLYANDGNAEPTALDNECSILHPSSEADFDYESDDDVVIEGYDEEDTIEICDGTTGEEIKVIQINQTIVESSNGVKEASCEDKELDIRKMAEEAENENERYGKENVPPENLDPPIDLTQALLSDSTKEERREQEKLGHLDKKVNEAGIQTAESENNADASDETKIQCLFEEASKSIDANKSDEEWDNLVSNISGEDFSDEKFNDLVSSFGSALKKQIVNKESKDISETKEGSLSSDLVSEDLAMYDLISTMEDKTGQSLSAVVTKLANSESATDGSSSGNALKETVYDSAFSVIEQGPENLPRLLSSLKLSENGPSADNVGMEESNEPSDNDHEHIRNEPLLLNTCKEKDEEKCTDREEINSDKAELAMPNEVDGPFRQDKTNAQVGNDSLVSWECVDINSGVSSAIWDPKSESLKSDSDVHQPKPCRAQRSRMPGDPSKWLDESVQDENVDEAIASWMAVDGGTPQWDNTQSSIIPEQSPAKKGATSPTPRYLEVEEPQSHTGAVSKHRKHKRRGKSSSPNNRRTSKGDTVPIVTVYQEKSENVCRDKETQTLSIDFEALQLDHELYELKVLFGKPHYVPVTTTNCSLSEKGPLTKGGLKLEKGTMTDNVHEGSVSSFQNLVAFFPNIPKDDLRDVFEKCKYDSDWAMNVLLDSGYEMSDPNDISVHMEEDIETNSVSETTNMGEGKNEHSSCDTSDAAFDSFVDERTRKIRQSKQPNDLAKKLEIEKSFAFPDSVDDRVLRLTGKEYSDLNMTKVKKNKSKKHQRKGSSPPSNIKAEESVEGEGEGAQYITLVMDPLFASQLNMMFGPVGDYEISGDLTYEDRSVVLPLEICEMIHKYWARTVNGKFKHEAEILDSLVRQDEILARKLQEEENAAFNLSDNDDDVTNDGMLEDKPVCFQEIMDLEQALQESLTNKSTPEDTSISSILSLKRLYKEYPHVDPVALKEEFTRNGFKYHITAQKLNQKFGKEQGTPKTVIAPEAISRYEQEMIERAQQDSLAEVVDVPPDQHDEIVPDNPQVFRDEAQAHYHQRQEAFQKAQEAHRRGMKAAAAYYAYIGNLHSEKLREANQRASQKILEAQNAHRKDASCLDLHLLHVPEARSATQAFLHERQRVLIARGIRQMEVSLITGRGAHSSGGQAVLKPAIKEHLQKNGYSFYEANSGMLKVILRAKPS